jgi:hypothetical protein
MKYATVRVRDYVFYMEGYTPVLLMPVRWGVYVCLFTLPVHSHFPMCARDVLHVTRMAAYNYGSTFPTAYIYVYYKIKSIKRFK